SPRQLPSTQGDGGRERQHRSQRHDPETRAALLHGAVQRRRHRCARRGARSIIGAMKYIIAVAFVGILASLGWALFFMLRDGRDGRAKSGGMARALTVRIGLSVVLFLCLLLAWKLGYIQPGGLPVGK